MAKTVYVLGNELMQKDALAVLVSRKLKGLNGIEFKHVRDPAELFQVAGDEVLVMDVVRGLHKVRWIDDLGVLKRGGVCSLHDFDFAFFVEMMLAKGDCKKFKILGLPMQYRPEKAIEEARALLEKEATRK